MVVGDQGSSDGLVGVVVVRDRPGTLRQTRPNPAGSVTHGRQRLEQSRRLSSLSVARTSVDDVGQTPTVDATETISGPASTGDTRPDLDLERYRGELTGYCYRMLGSTFDADDAVQECLVRAWQAAGRFEGRASVRSWLYRIATNVCLDLLRSRQRRALPMDLSSPVPSTTPPPETLADHVWVEPVADRDVILRVRPAEQAVIRDTVRLAFVAALQLLPPRRRAVLILREVLCWSAVDVADLLDTTVASVNSALQRARATLAEHRAEPGDGRRDLGEAERDLLARYVEAFERYDIQRLVGLSTRMRSISMPPSRCGCAAPRTCRAGPSGTASVQRIASDTARGQRVTGLRPVPSRRRRGAARAVVDPSARDPRRADRAHPSLPRHPPVRALRAPRPPLNPWASTGMTASSPTYSSSRARSLPAPRTSRAKPRRAVTRRSRLRTSTRARSGRR